MAGNGEQMRMWGGWKGLPLPASHWPGMTTFSLEAPSSLLHPPSSPFSSPLPPSVFTSLSCFSAAILITTGTLSYNVSILDRQEETQFWCCFCFCFVSFFWSSPVPLMDAYLELPLSINCFSPPSLHLSSLPQPALLPCWLAMYFSNMLLLSTVQTSATEPPQLAISC